MKKKVAHICSPHFGRRLYGALQRNNTNREYNVQLKN